jgi:hypothetical protein
MGEHSDQWADASDGPKARLNTAAARYKEFKQGAQFTDRLNVQHIVYDRCFATEIDKWQESGAKLNDWAKSANRPLPKIVNWLSDTLPKSQKVAKGFLWSTAMDPVLYRGFTLVRDYVRATVMSQLVSILTEEGGAESLDVTIVAHSLGTAVMHDALHMLGTGQLPQEVKDSEVFRPDRWKFSNFFMIADVCLLGPPAVRDIDYFGSIVRPQMPDGSVEGYCRKFFEVWHRYDPFAIAAPFRPGDWGRGYVPIGPLSHFRQANVHGFTHYLDHPRVHIPLINYALGDEVISPEESDAAIAAYPDVVSKQCDAQIQLMKDEAKKFASIGNDLEEIAIRLAEFYALAVDATEKCKGLSLPDE